MKKLQSAPIAQHQHTRKRSDVCGFASRNCDDRLLALCISEQKVLWHTMKCAVAVLRASARTAVRLAVPCTGKASAAVAVPRCTRAVAAAGRAAFPRGRVYGEYTAMRNSFHTQAAVLQEVPVPNMGDSITDGTLSVIEVAPGTHVNVDDVVAVLETDKVCVVASPVLCYLPPTSNPSRGLCCAGVVRGAHTTCGHRCRILRRRRRHRHCWRAFVPH